MSSVDSTGAVEGLERLIS